MRAVLGDYELPSFPVIVMNALEKIRNTDASNGEIADLVASDPGLSVRLLTTVNSAAYALKQKVTSVEHGVSLMGRGELESILISMAVHQVMPADDTPGFDTQRFWCTAAHRAALARQLADLIDPSSRSESFTAALLQDMAVPILAQQRTDDYIPVLQRWYETGADLAELERETFGWDHARVAMWMCDDWGFPARMAEAIGSHHGAGDEDLHELPAVSLVAVLLEQDTASGIEQLVDNAYTEYGLDRDVVMDLVETSNVSAQEIARMFS